MKIAICDNADSVLTRLNSAFSDNENITIVGSAKNVEDCKNLIRRTLPDVLIMDTKLGEYDDGIRAIKQCLEICAELKIVMFAESVDNDDVFHIFAYGAKDILYKSASNEEIADKIIGVYDGTAAIAPEFAEILAKKSHDVMNRQNSLLYTINQITKLSRSELNVLRNVYYGKTYREIATSRFVEEGTIRAQASGIMKKFSAKSMKNLVKSLKDMELFEFIDMYYENGK